MTTLTLYKKDEQYIGFRCVGHTGSAPEGEDLLCAVMSTMTQYCITCAEHLEMDVEYIVDDARLECKISKENPIFSALLSAMEKNVSQLEQDYPTFIRIIITEV